MICEQIVDVGGSQGCRAGYRSTQELKPRPNLATCSGTDFRCPCAGDGDTVVGSAENRPQDRILRQTVEQVASNREASVKVFSEELKALAEATQVLLSETSGADGQTYSSFQEDSSAALRTSTGLKGFELVILVRRLAEQEHCISATMKFGAGADGDPSVKVKDLITDLISRLQAEASSEKREDLEADVAKDSSKLEAAVARSIDGEISTQQVANTHVQHVVNTVEVEMPKIIKETVQRKRPIIQEKINQVTKHIKIPQVQFSCKG